MLGGGKLELPTPVSALILFLSDTETQIVQILPADTIADTETTF